MLWGSTVTSVWSSSSCHQSRSLYLGNLKHWSTRFLSLPWSSSATLNYPVFCPFSTFAVTLAGVNFQFSTLLYMSMKKSFLLPFFTFSRNWQPSCSSPLIGIHVGSPRWSTVNIMYVIIIAHCNRSICSYFDPKWCIVPDLENVFFLLSLGCSEGVAENYSCHNNWKKDGRFGVHKFSCTLDVYVSILQLKKITLLPKCIIVHGNMTHISDSFNTPDFCNLGFKKQNMWKYAICKYECKTSKSKQPPQYKHCEN